MYLPRLRDLSVLLTAVADGPRTLDMVRDGFGYAESFDEAEQRYRGLVVNSAVNAPLADGRTLLVRSEVALSQAAKVAAETGPDTVDTPTALEESATGVAGMQPPGVASGAKRPAPTRYFGRKYLNVNRVGLNASEIANEVVAHLNALQGVDVTVTMEIVASGPGFDEQVIRVVSENASALRFDATEFE